jgi:hypothetical protein
MSTDLRIEKLEREIKKLSNQNINIRMKLSTLEKTSTGLGQLLLQKLSKVEKNDPSTKKL